MPQVDAKLPRWMWIAFAALAVGAVILGAHPRRAIDLRVYLTAAQRFLEGTDLYRAADGAMPFKYAPQSAWLFLPIAWLPGPLAAAIWNLLSVAGLAWAAKVTVRLTGAPPKALLWGLAVLLHPLYLEFHYGQVDLAILVVLVAAFVQSERGPRGEWWAGLLIALAILLKAPSVLVLAVPLLRLQWRVLAGCLAGGLCASLPLIARYGLGGTIDQTRGWLSLIQSSTAPWILGHNPQGLPTVLLAMLGANDPPSASAMTLAQLFGVLILGLVIAVAHVRAPERRFEVFTQAMAASVLASPLAWRANFVVLFPLVVMALVSRDKLRVAACLALLAVGLVLNPFLWGPETFQQLMRLRPFFVAGMGIVLVSIPHRARPNRTARI